MRLVIRYVDLCTCDEIRNIDLRIQVCNSDGTCFYYHLTYIRPAYIDPVVDFIVDAFTA